MVHRILALAVLLVLSSQSLWAQDQVLSATAAKDDSISIDFGKDGMKLDAFLEMAQEFTGLHFTFDSRHINASETTINVRGRITVQRSEIESFLQDVCMAHQFLWHRLGTQNSALIEVIRLQTAQFLKQNAVPISWEKVDSCGSHSAEVFSCIVPLEYIDCQQIQRTLNNLIQEHRASFVWPVDDANAVMICGTGRQMTAFAAAIRSAESLAATERAKAWRAKAEAEKVLKNK